MTHSSDQPDSLKSPVIDLPAIDPQVTDVLSTEPLAIATRSAVVGDSLNIRRALPSRQKRLIGAWCFLDHAGPIRYTAGQHFSVGAHPHIGLQTFTWMIEGELFHQDSLGYQQIIRPGEINLMTAGNGISHIERSPDGHSPDLHLTQLWIALPDEARHMPPRFDHYSSLPIIEQDHCRITVLAGEFMGQTSPVLVYSPLVGLDIVARAASQTTLTLNPEFEYGILLLEGQLEVNDVSVDCNTLLYLAAGQQQLQLKLEKNTRLLLIGGEPFKEDVIIWWNFVARTHAEIEQANNDWLENDLVQNDPSNLDSNELAAKNRFGQVTGFEQDRLSPPPLTQPLRASR